MFGGVFQTIQADFSIDGGLVRQQFSDYDGHDRILSHHLTVPQVGVEEPRFHVSTCGTFIKGEHHETSSIWEYGYES